MLQFLYWLSFSGVIVFIDHFTKYLAIAKLYAYEPLVITSFLNLTLAFNKGAAFSLLNSAGGWQQWLFGGIAVLVSVVLINWLYRLPRKEFGQGLALSLILAGAIGNLLDRIFRGYVVDFIDFHWYQYHWPIFNVADAAISIGAVLFIWFGVLRNQSPAT